MESFTQKRSLSMSHIVAQRQGQPRLAFPHKFQTVQVHDMTFQWRFPLVHFVTMDLFLKHLSFRIQLFFCHNSQGILQHFQHLFYKTIEDESFIRWWYVYIRGCVKRWRAMYACYLILSPFFTWRIYSRKLIKSRKRSHFFAANFFANQSYQQILDFVSRE